MHCLHTYYAVDSYSAFCVNVMAQIGCILLL